MMKYKEFTKQAKAERLKRGMIQQTLAELCNVSRMTIYRFENGKAVLSHNNCLMVAEVLGIEYGKQIPKAENSQNLPAMPKEN